MEKLLCFNNFLKAHLLQKHFLQAYTECKQMQNQITNNLTVTVIYNLAI